MTPVQRKWSQIRGQIEETLKIGDDDLIDVVMGTTLSIDLPQNPIWLMVVAPSGGSKTEVLRMMKGNRTYHATAATANSLVSGMVIKKRGPGRPRKDKKETAEDQDPSEENVKTSLLERLNNKVWFMRDMSQMLQLPMDQRNKVFGVLRNAYDGDISQVYGGEAQEQRFRCHFGIIGAVTSIWEKVMNDEDRAFGERFLCFRPRPKDRYRFCLHVQRMAATSHEWRPALEDLILGFLDEVKVKLDPDYKPKGIARMSDFCAMVRSPAPRDPYTKEITFLPEAEYGSRICVQLYLLARVLDFLGANTQQIIKRIIRSTIPQKRYVCLQTLHKHACAKVNDVLRYAPFSRNLAQQELDNLTFLGLLNRSRGGASEPSGEKGAPSYVYTVKEEMAEAFHLVMGPRWMDGESDDETNDPSSSK